MSLNEFLEDILTAGGNTFLISLDFKCAFEAHCWLHILSGLKAYNCPKNPLKSNRYFCQRTAVLSSNKIFIEKTVSKMFPQASWCGYLYILHNSLLNFQFTISYKELALADDLIFWIRNEKRGAAGAFRSLK